MGRKPISLFDMYLSQNRADAYKLLERQIADLEATLIPEFSQNNQREHYLFSMVRFLAFLSQDQHTEIEKLKTRLALVEKDMGILTQDIGEDL